ncbi:ion transporter [Desulfomarina profundi]|uniref:Ion transporter n=2 Tax=Desulfomarina profundi TaxID=2772557 RepID=A0A8D5JHX1_9BACT|nr:ion transporter [Desulfomarina profundi]
MTLSSHSKVMTMKNNLTSDEQESTESGGILKKILTFFNFGRPGTKEDLEHEIQELLEEGEEHGLITSLEEKMISSIFDFRETCAAEVMTPAAEVVSFNEAAPVSELIDTIIDNGLTRIPIYRDNPDQIIGVIHAKDLLAFCTRSNEEKEQLEKYLRPVSFVSESKLIVDLLPEFQKRKEHMAMVTDEFGTIRGLITLEDILEEIVGEIDDEYDVKQDKIEEVGPNTIRVHARMDVEKIEEYFGVEFQEGPFESIGGMIIYSLGRLARPGDSVRISGFSFEVESATERHLQSVLITRLQEEE